VGPARLFRLFAVAGAALVALGLFAAPAAAHGRGSESTNYESRVLEAPEIDGVTWEIIGGDQYLAVRNTTDAELVVAGYDGEDYLRIGPEGVFHNLASEAAYVNADRYGEVTSIPPDVGAEQEPRWAKLSDDPSHAWHDHRIHWMSPMLPPAVTDPGKSVVIPMGAGGTDNWTVPFTHDGKTYEVTGQLRWVPPPSPVPWIGLGLLLTAPALLGLRNRMDADWVRRLVRPAAVVLLVVAAANLTHLVDDFAAVPGPLSTKLVSAVQTALFIALGIFGALTAWRGRDGAFTALGVGAGGIFVGQGVLYWDALRTALSASVFPGWLTRVVVGASLAQVLWVGAIAVIGNRRLAAVAPQATDEPSEVPAT
jgi:hypothetical protein